MPTPDISKWFLVKIGMKEKQLTGNISGLVIFFYEKQKEVTHVQNQVAVFYHNHPTVYPIAGSCFVSLPQPNKNGRTRN